MLIPCDLPLAKLSLQWMGATRLRTLVLSESLPCLRKLAFPHGTDLLVDASPSDCRAPHLGARHGWGCWKKLSFPASACRPRLAAQAFNPSVFACRHAQTYRLW